MGARDIEIKELSPQPAVIIRERTTAEGMGPAMRALYPALIAFLEERGVRPAGPSFAVFHTYSEDEVDFEAGFPVPEPVEGEGRVAASQLPGGPAAVTTHVGPYDTIGQVHDAMDAFLHGRGGEHGGPPREVYLSGPGDEPDSSRWRTEVIYPIG